MEQRAHNRSIQSYSSELFENLLQLEGSTSMNPELIKSQPQISIEMRSVLFDFLMDVHNRLKLTNTTFYLTINIIDRYCSLRIVRKDHFQLLGLTALWLASKFSDPKNKIPTIDFLRATCCNCYSKSLFVEMESHILKSLGWEMGSAGHDSFIDLILRDRFMDKFKIDTINSIRYGANYLCQLMQLYHSVTFNFSVSQISLASVLIVSLSSRMSQENKLTQFAPKEEDDHILDELIQIMLKILRNESLPSSFKKRYFNSANDLKVNPVLYNIYRYSNELSRFQYPKTPLASPLNSARSSPTSSRSPSTSSSSSAGISRCSSSFSLLTPPTSGSASPVNESYAYIENHQKYSNKFMNRVSTDPVTNNIQQDELINENRKRFLDI